MFLSAFFPYLVLNWLFPLSLEVINYSRAEKKMLMALEIQIKKMGHLYTVTEL